MAVVADIVNVSLTISAASLTRPGFGKPLILAYDWPVALAGLYQEYSSAAAVATAGFPITGPTYLMAAKMFSQNPCPPLIAIGKGALPATQKFTLAPSGTIATGMIFSVELDGIEYSFTVGATQTIEAVVDGLVAALPTTAWQSSTDYVPGAVVTNSGNVYQCASIVGAGESAAAGGPTTKLQGIADFQTAGTNGVYWNYISPAMTISDAGDTETTVTLVAGNAGEFHNLSVTPLQSTNLAVAQTHADPGVATDLSAILAQNPTWYAFCTEMNSKALIVAADAWAEANGKLYAAQTQDSAVINVAPLTGSDVAVTLAASTALRTALIYKSTTSDFADAAWLGACLPLAPGSETWGLKSLVSVPAESGLYALSETQRSNACGAGGTPGGKFCNVYENVGGANITEKGTVSGNEWIDVIRGRDWLQVNMSIDVFASLLAGEKLPYTDAGIAVIAGDIRADLKAGVAAGFLDGDGTPPFTVSVPSGASVSAADRQNRVLNNVTFSATLAGAIQCANITGVLSFASQ